jgi:hypothetical protein
LLAVSQLLPGDPPIAFFHENSFVITSSKMIIDDFSSIVTHSDDISSFVVYSDGVAKDWAADQAARIGDEIRRLRGPRSGQWLSDRTDALGYRVARTTISELENHKRKLVSTAELVVLARALDTAPIVLLYPPPYSAELEVLPDGNGTSWAAVEWFSGRNDGGNRAEFTDDVEAYDRNLAPLKAAAKISDLTTKKMKIMERMVDYDANMQMLWREDLQEIDEEIERLRQDGR